MKKNLFPCFLVVGICLIDFFASAGYLFLKSQNGTLLHLKDVSDNIFPYTLQTLICIIVPVILFIVYMVILKKEFNSRTGHHSLIPRMRLQSVFAGLAFFRILAVTTYLPLILEK